MQIQGLKTNPEEQIRTRAHRHSLQASVAASDIDLSDTHTPSGFNLIKQNCSTAQALMLLLK